MSFDERLRRLLGEALPPEPVADADALVAELTARLGSVAKKQPPRKGRRGRRGPGPGVLIVVAALIAGGVIGLLLGGGDSTTPGDISDRQVVAYACPGGDEVGTLHQGDRVQVVGRRDGWLAIRGAEDGQVVFVEESAVAVEGGIAGLPEVACPQEEPTPTVTTSGPVAITTSPTSSSTTTPTTETTGAITSPSVAVTTTPAPVTTTTAPDVTVPVMEKEAVAPEVIWEQDSESLACPPANPRQATITAIVTDDREPVVVTASWTLPGGSPVVVTMTRSGDVHSATFGPFPAGTVPEDPASTTVTITITAADAAGNRATAELEVSVTSLATCFG